MALEKRYDAQEVEPRLQAFWQESGIYHFDPTRTGEVYSIDTPPATVSGHLHLGHVYSYTHVDLIARFWRMRGRRVFYPMGFDDNGLPTERLVEKQLGQRAEQVGRSAFIEKCLEIGAEAEKEYRALWERIGLSVDWRYTYRTIEPYARRIAQASFIDLYRKGLVYRGEAPAIWCPECHTALAQADVNDLERESEFVTLKFRLLPDEGGPSAAGPVEDGPEVYLPIATTRPELLAACVSIFVHPEDARYRAFVGKQAEVPLYGRTVPIMEDPSADPEKGTGAVMCCTFGDTADVDWWYKHRLPLIQAIERDGRMSPVAGDLAGLHIEEARRKVKERLAEAGLLLERNPLTQVVRVHERCDTPVEFIVAPQWFIRILDFKEELLRAGERVNWRPEGMRARYCSWVENLNWDWCISRQRSFGIMFPLWYCKSCGEVMLADEAQLPVDPLQDTPGRACACGGTEFVPESDVFDTWMTSSMTPQIVGCWLRSPDEEEAPGPRLYEQVFPFSLRPQAHDIIRTWAFYTLVKSRFHFGEQPWENALISGWGIAGEGMGKISKSRGGGPVAPMEMLRRHSADAVRYWAASAGPGKDAVINEEKISAGGRLVTKLWNVARFAEPFILPRREADALQVGLGQGAGSRLSPADRWILSRLNRLIERTTALMEQYEYAAARSEVEGFFWSELANNYLEFSKQRLYTPTNPGHSAARFALTRTLLAVFKLFSPFLPHVTEKIYRGLFENWEPRPEGAPLSIHISAWPEVEPAFDDAQAERTGAVLVEIATALRRYKSERGLSLGAELGGLCLWLPAAGEREQLEAASDDLMSITRARRIELLPEPPTDEDTLQAGEISLVVIR